MSLYPFEAYEDYDDFDLDASGLESDISCDLCHEDCAEDVDCIGCGLKFWIRSCLYGEGKQPWPEKCQRCQQGLPPLYEY